MPEVGLQTANVEPGLNEKLSLAEKRIRELEARLGGELTGGSEHRFIVSTCKARLLEDENATLKQKLATIDQYLQQTSPGEESGLLEKLKLLLDPGPELACSVDASPRSPDVVDAISKRTKLQVKVELEVERRLRIQAALDDAEKRCFAANRDLESKASEIQRLSNEVAKVKEASEAKLRQVNKENSKLQKIIRQKEEQCEQSEARAKDLMLKAEEFEDMFNGQLDVVKSLQADLSIADEENKNLVREMEMLSCMFHELERTHVTEALRDYQTREPDLSDATHKDQKGQVVGVQELLQAVDKENESPSSIQDSCFKEVTTRRGTSMVLSVSKTFLKLKDLIIEKKTLEDQVEKMKVINTQLCSKLDMHEAKLFNITDELNKTWVYVSTLKLQHKKLHTNEQILRAELNEKKQILAKLREELEYSRKNWQLVKQKTADSEKEWRALKHEFASRRLQEMPSFMCATSSESGFSDSNQTDLEEDCNSPAAQRKQKAPSLPQMQSEKEEEEEAAPSDAPSTESTTEDAPTTYKAFIPSLEYLTHVPEEFLPPLFPEEEEEAGSGSGGSCGVHQDEEEAELQEPCSYNGIYQRLIASTTRSAILANQLAELNRCLGKDDDVVTLSLETHEEEDEEDEEEEEEEEDDLEPRTEPEEEGSIAESPDLVSDVVLTGEMLDDIQDSGNEDEDDDDEEETSSLASDASLEAPLPPDFDLSGIRLSADSEAEEESSSAESSATPCASSPAFSEDGEDLPLWDEDNTLEEEGENTERHEAAAGPSSEAAPEVSVSSSTSSPAPHIPPAPPPPPFSLLPPSATFRPGSGFANADSSNSSDSDSEENTDTDEDQEMESTTAVTRFLIKHLPKHMSRLRHDKAELEVKIENLEETLSQQNVALAELERRNGLYKREVDRLHGRELPGVSTNASLNEHHPIKHLDIPLIVPQNAVLKWSFSSAPQATFARILLKSCASNPDSSGTELVAKSEVVPPFVISTRGQAGHRLHLGLSMEQGGMFDNVRFLIAIEEEAEEEEEK